MVELGPDPQAHTCGCHKQIADDEDRCWLDDLDYHSACFDEVLRGMSKNDRADS
jgi:hypothetical protein